ncbi:hypothetical protein [Thermomicrobium sp.]
MTPPEHAPTRWSALVDAVVSAVTRSRSRTGQPLDPALVEELRIALAARRELGPDYDRELAEAFLTEVNRALEERVEQLWRQHERRRRRTAIGRGLLLTVVLLTSVPLTFVAGVTTGVTGIVVVWVGLIVLTALALILLRGQ